MDSLSLPDLPSPNSAFRPNPGDRKELKSKFSRGVSSKACGYLGVDTVELSSTCVALVESWEWVGEVTSKEGGSIGTLERLL